MEKSWKEAIKKVLAESEAPMHYTEISEQILSRGYYETDGATPAATVSAQLTSSIKHDGEKSPFLRVGKGIFSLKNSPATVIIPAPTPISKNNKLETLSELKWNHRTQSFIPSECIGSVILLCGATILKCMVSNRLSPNR
ncbi:MAG: winged helix-turn-helix domain-containing protein [Desulfuromonadales bacterium]